MKNKKRNYSDEFKLQIVNEYLEGPLGCRLLARKYNLPSKNYINNWIDQLIRKGILKEEDVVKKDFSKFKDKITNDKNKTPYEKQLERENIELRAKLAFYEEMKKLIEEDKDKNKKK